MHNPLPQIGDLHLTRFPYGTSCFAEMKLRPALVIDLYTDPFLRLVILRVIRITLKKKGDKRPFALGPLIDCRASWALDPALNQTRYANLRDILDLPMHPAFFPHLDAEGHLRRIGRISDEDLDVLNKKDLLARKMFSERSLHQSILKQFIINPQSIFGGLEPDRRRALKFDCVGAVGPEP